MYLLLVSHIEIWDKECLLRSLYDVIYPRAYSIESTFRLS